MSTVVSASSSLLSGISVVIPVFNSESSLPILVPQIVETLSKLNEPFEIILVNDGSKDKSWQTIESLAAQNPSIFGIHLMRNYGQHGALLAGVRAARYSVTVTLDDDLQTPAEEIPKLLEKLHQGYDLVYGTPIQEGHGLWRFLSSRVVKIFLSAALGAETARIISPFRAFRTMVRDAFAIYNCNYLILDVLLTWGTSSFASVRVKHHRRQFGRSHYNFFRLIRHSLNMLTGFSTAPLKLATWVGFTVMAFGVGVLVYVLGRYVIVGGSVPGFPFLASTIAVFSGAQLFALGIFGEYLSQMYTRILEKPPYVIRETIRSSKQRSAA